MKRLRPILIAISAVFATSLAVPAFAQSKHAPRISMETARATAIKRVAGTVLTEEYEKEGGHWIYTFDIRPKGETGRRIVEVTVDADSGRIVDVHPQRGSWTLAPRKAISGRPCGRTDLCHV